MEGDSMSYIQQAVVLVFACEDPEREWSKLVNGTRFPRSSHYEPLGENEYTDSAEINAGGNALAELLKEAWHVVSVTPGSGTAQGSTWLVVLQKEFTPIFPEGMLQSMPDTGQVFHENNVEGHENNLN